MRDAGLGIRDMTYRDLDIWKLAREATKEVHAMSLTALPKFEMFETGSQVRRSVKSVRSNIVEGFGLRRYKQEYIRYLIYSHASCDETIDHIETLRDCQSLQDEILFRRLIDLMNRLGGKLNRFIQAVEEQHISPK